MGIASLHPSSKVTGSATRWRRNDYPSFSSSRRSMRSMRSSGRSGPDKGLIPQWLSATSRLEAGWKAGAPSEPTLCKNPAWAGLRNETQHRQHCKRLKAGFRELNPALRQDAKLAWRRIRSQSQSRRLSAGRDTDATSAQPTRMLAGRTDCLVCRTVWPGSSAAGAAGRILRGCPRPVPTLKHAPGVAATFDSVNLAGSTIDQARGECRKPVRSGVIVTQQWRTGAPPYPSRPELETESMS